MEGGSGGEGGGESGGEGRYLKHDGTLCCINECNQVLFVR